MSGAPVPSPSVAGRFLDGKIASPETEMIGLQSTPRQLEAARACGLWLDKTLLDFLDEVTPGRLDKVALTDSNSEPGQTAQRR